MSRVAAPRGALAMGLTSTNRRGRAVTAAAAATIEPNEWPASTGSPPTASSSSVAQAAYPVMSWASAGSGGEAPKPGRSGTTTRSAPRWAVMGSSPWWSPRRPCRNTTVCAASGGP